MGSLAKRFAAAVSPRRFLLTVGFVVYAWQARVLQPHLRRVVLLCSRQSGKSTIVAAIALWTAIFRRGSLTLIVAPAKDQAQETMGKIKDFFHLLPGRLKDTKRDSQHEMVLSNGSRILALPGTERASRGYSAPDVVILDEAARIPDETYMAIRPTMTKNPHARMFLLSTPNGKQGFFYRAWSREDSVWTRVMVLPKFELIETADGWKIVEREESEEEFRERQAEKGIEAYYSPHHEKWWLEEELMELSEYGFKQEYNLEFVEAQDALFLESEISGMLTDEVRSFVDPDYPVTGGVDEVNDPGRMGEFVSVGGPGWG